MKKALNKSEAIQKAIEAYKNNDTLNIRAVARLYGYSDKSIANHLNNKIKPASDYFVSYQKPSPVEEKILTQHIIRAYNSGFLLTIQHLNDYANELLRIKDVNTTINYH